MNWTLEVVVVPVSNVERAKTFYAEKLGFAVDHDTRISDKYHVVQLTPPGSGCSIVVGKGVVGMQPGSFKGLQLVVRDVRAARAQLVEHGVEVGEVQVVGPSGPRPARDGDDLDNVGFVFFDDPDGNGWGGRPPLGVPTFVVTHTVPQEWVYEGSPFTFVTDGVASAVEQAKAAAGGKDVAVGAASITQQCIKAGLLDQIHVDLVPVLLGGGVRLFDHLGAGPIELERTEVVEGVGVTHLTFRVVK